jgi:hypothetical protein
MNPGVIVPTQMQKNREVLLPPGKTSLKRME